MSADNSPRSGPNQPQSSNRLERARAQALADASARPSGSSMAATAAQARQDLQTKTQRSPSDKVSEISALLTTRHGVDRDGDSAEDVAARRERSPSPDDRGAGREDGVTPQPDRPALELDDEPGEAPPKKRKSLSDFADEHEVKAKALYDLEVSFDGDGSIEPATIGELKDHYVKTRAFERERDDFDDWRESAQLEVMQARTQLDDVVNRLTQVVPPDMLARAFRDMQDGQANALEKARTQLAEWFPQWADVQVKIRDRQRLESSLSTYGFSRTEIGNVQDARLIKFAMDAINLRERYQRLREGERDKQPTKAIVPSTRKERKPSATERADALAKSGDKYGAIATLIGNANGYDKS